MVDQERALRLADEISKPWYRWQAQTEAAAELRRLHAEHTEDQTVIAVWRGRTLRAEQQRDELLEALRPFTEATLTYNGAVIGLMREDFDRARAAIARAEGEPK